VLIKIKKAQSTLEYALLVGLVVGALLSMQNYMKRGLQGKFQAIGDQFGDQYSPGETERVDEMTVRNATITEVTTSGTDGKIETSVEGGYQESTSSRKLRSLDEETWVK